MREAFLDENKSVFSQSQEHSIDVNLTVKTRSLPYNNLMGELSAFQLYNNERDASNKYRMIFTVNPVCSNVLFNMKTEVMKDEGSDNCKVLFDDKPVDVDDFKYAGNSTTGVTRKQAIKDTEYSHNEIGGLVYHCGLDIFNNHMLRNDGFTHINKNLNDIKTDKYNTLEDTLRDCNGNSVNEKVGVIYDDKNETSIHLYQHDTILTFYEAFLNRISIKNGWYGFTNPGNIDIPNLKIGDKNISINRMLLGNKACEFIDMYPDRTLYSFIPKYNKFRNRIEKNWNYAITYVYKADKDKVNEINGNSKNNAIQCFWKRCYDSNGNDTLCCRTLFRHTLSKNDRVRFYYGTDQTRMEASVRVISTGKPDGTEQNRYFSVKYESVARFAENGFKDGLWYRKETNGSECEYYFKILKKVLYRDSNGNEVEPRNSITKGAFAENIYGDPIAQIVYTDDINTDGLKDNLGRPVSSLYFTVVKNNAGYKEWYKQDTFTGDTIEYSHCFGKITGGLDLGKKEDLEEEDSEGNRIWSGFTDSDFIRNYNCRYIHNIDITDGKISSYWGEEIAAKPEALYGLKEGNMQDEGITIGDDEFWGDVVEFNPAEYTETVIENTYYRFNTAQREISNSQYSTIKYDELIYDDYDLNDTKKTTFETKEYFLNGKNNNEQTLANICPEGYFYHSNYEMQVKELSNLNSVDCLPIGDKLELSIKEIGEDYKLKGVKITECPIDYKFIKDDTIGFFNIKDKKTFWGCVDNVDENNLPWILLSDEDYDYFKENRKNIIAIVSEYSTPTYSRYLPSSGKLVWRSVLSASETPNDSDVYNLPFANGCFYIEKGFNIFVRRQDPNNEFGLLWGKGEKKNPMKKYYIEGSEPIDMSAVQYILDKYKNICY